jgi:hypothetical protein
LPQDPLRASQPDSVAPRTDRTTSKGAPNLEGLSELLVVDAIGGALAAGTREAALMAYVGKEARPCPLVCRTAKSNKLFNSGDLWKTAFGANAQCSSLRSDLRGGEIGKYDDALVSGSLLTTFKNSTPEPSRKKRSVLSSSAGRSE